MKGFEFDLAVTHDTIFHADDVFGAALCTMLNPLITVMRTTDMEVLELYKDDPMAIIFDIGLGKYDHHQEDKALRADGTPYCGFGLLWKDFGHLLCPDDEAWKTVDESLVYAIDAADNGVKQNLLSASIKTMNPCWDSTMTEDEAFYNHALPVAKEILTATIEHANASIRAADVVELSYLASPTEEILILDEYMPWSKTVHDDPRFKNVLFVVYPSKRGGWNVQTVPKEPGQFVNRMDFPTDWLGHADPERGIHFAHTANFLIACNTKEQAIRVAQEAVEAGQDPYKVVCSI